MPQIYTDRPALIRITRFEGGFIEYCCTEVIIDQERRMRQYYPEGMLENPDIYEIHDSVELTIRGRLVPKPEHGPDTCKQETIPLEHQLAHAILDGDKDAVWPLIDYLLETRSRQP